MQNVKKLNPDKPKKILIVVDMQNDFVDGTLGSAAARAIVLRAAAKIEAYLKSGDPVIFTLDTHGADYLSTAEGLKLPVVHCVEGTHGHELHKSIGAILQTAKMPATLKTSKMSKMPAPLETPKTPATFIIKNTFGTLEWSDTAIVDGDELELIGLCTDICVVSNALILQATFPRCKLTVDSSACAGTSEAAHDAALTVMRSCQIEVI
jgi:nicotinamidase-related amidase